MAFISFNPKDHFNTKVYAGTGSTNTKTGVGFQPDLIWVKNRSDAEDHCVMDSVRTFASGKAMRTNGSDEEGGVGTAARGWVVAASDGFTTNSGSSNSNLVNDSGNNYVAWCWKGGGAGSANTDGSINTTSTSANTTAGISISKYTGTGSNATIGHGLGVAPSFITVKRTDTGDSWQTYHKSLGAGKFLNLNNTDAESSNNNRFGGTEPTTSVFSIGTDAGVNASGGTYIAYCFAQIRGFSQFGRYEGNENANGQFLFTGFKPGFLMIKNKGTTKNWNMFDTARTPNNIVKGRIEANDNAAEETGDSDIDLISNGFKLRRSTSELNHNGNTYVYMAFAEFPFVTAGKKPCTAE